MPVGLDQLGQSKIETRLDFGTSVHRGAKASAARFRAIDRNNKGLFAASFVTLINIWAGEKDPVLDRYRAEFTCAHADKGETLRWLLILDYRKAVALAARPPQPLNRGMQKPLPRMRPDCIAEERCIGPAFKSVATGVLTIGPPDRKLGNRGHLVIDDGAVAHRWTDHAIASARQSSNDPLHDMRLYGELGANCVPDSLFRFALPSFSAR